MVGPRQAICLVQDSMDQLNVREQPAGWMLAKPPVFLLKPPLCSFFLGFAVEEKHR